MGLVPAEVVNEAVCQACLLASMLNCVTIGLSMHVGWGRRELGIWVCVSSLWRLIPGITGHTGTEGRSRGLCSAL